MIRNRFGKKFIGTALSLAMAVTAFPAMTALASERDFSNLYSSYKHYYSATPLEDVSLDELTSRYNEIVNYYNANK